MIKATGKNMNEQPKVIVNGRETNQLFCLQEIVHNTKLMLGEPAVKLEFAEHQVDQIVVMVMEHLDAYLGAAFEQDVRYKELVREGALALATITLGHIRGQCGAKPQSHDAIGILGGDYLYQDGRRMKTEWESNVKRVKVELAAISRAEANPTTGYVVHGNSKHINTGTYGHKVSINRIGIR